MAWIFKLFIKYNSDMNEPSNMSKAERVLNWAMTIGVALWQALQYILTNRPAH